MARINPWLLFGLGAAGMMWFATRAKAASTSGQSYTVPALDTSVPGVSFAPSTLQPGVLTSTLTAVPAVTGQQAAQAQSFWNTLQPVNPPDTGYITFPSGSQVAASLLTGGNTRIDGAGNYYALWGGQVYQLGAMDSSGNWPTQLVTG